MTGRKQIATNYTYEPLQFHGLAHYDSAGQLQSISVSLSGHVSVLAKPDEGEALGDVFTRAFEGAKVLLLTQRAEPVYAPEPQADDKEEAGSR